MSRTSRALRTSLCVAIARRMSVGLWLAAAAVAPAWATHSALPPGELMAVEMATFSESARAATAADARVAVPPSMPAEAVMPPAPAATPVQPTPVEAAPATAAAADKPKRTARKARPARAEPLMSDEAFAALVQVLLTRDNRAAPFVIIDKRRAHLWLFDAQGSARGDSAVLLGLARGDDTAPGVGDKPLAHIRDHERTTPAGRFIAEPGRNGRGDDVLWVDYDAALSMHRVHAVNRGERREQRLASPGAADNRISYGCINVPVAFYDRTLLPLLGGQRPVVYLLPETRPLHTLFNPATQTAARQLSSPRKGS